MKKFTRVWKWMMIVLFSSSILFVYGQKDSYNEVAPKKTVTSEEQLKLLEAGGILAEEADKQMAEDYLLEHEKYLKELKMQDEQVAELLQSTSNANTIFNSDNTVTITLGTGTSTNTTTGNPTPYGTYFKNFRQQYLILASELMALSMGPGDIIELGFEVAALNTCVDMPDFTISMKETTATALTTTFDNTGYTTVFTLPTFLPVVGWNMHVFDTPFTWDGTSNIIVDVCTSLIPGAYTQNASVYYTPTTGTNTCARYQSDTQPACNTTNAATVSANRANMMITGEEMLNPPPQMPYNELPISGSLDVAVDGDISWTFGNNTDNYDLWFGPAGNMVKVVDNQPAGANGTYTFSALSYATTYNWQVVAMNTNGTTNGPIWSFTTICGAINSFPWVENFDGTTFPPFCWERYSGLLVDPVVLTPATSGWILDDWRNIVTGDKAARVNIYSTTAKYWLVTPEIDLGSGGYQLEYDLTLNQYSTSNPPNLTGVDDRFAVLISTDAGATWSTSDIVQLWDNAGSPLIYNDIDPGGETIIFDMTGYTGSVKIAFYGESTVSNADNDLMINNLKVRVPPTCPDPTGLDVTGITGNSAILNWVSNSGLSDIEFGLAGFTPTGVPTHTGVTSPYDMTGLDPSTGYAFYVRDDCGGGDYSAWIGPENFTTACATFVAPFVENFQNTTIPLCWTMSGPQSWLFTTTWPGYGATGLQDHTGTGGSFAGVDGSGTAGLTGITLLTPPIDVTPLTDPALRFYLFNNNDDPNTYYQTLSVDLWDGSAWNNGIYFWGPTDNNPDWVEVIIALSPYTITGDVQFRFVVDKGAGSPFYDDLIIDDVYVEEAPTCPAPTGLDATGITGNSAILNWLSISGLSDIEFGLAGFTPTGVPTHTGLTSPFDMTGLDPSTGYSFYVRDDCGGGEYSYWVGPKTFTTACATFIAPFVENFQNTTIPLCWTMSGPQSWLFTTTWPGYGATGLQDHTGTGGSFAGVDGSGTASIAGITLLTPPIDVNALTVPQLRFYLFNNNIDNTDWQSLQVDLWNGTAWNDAIYSWGPTDNNPDWVEVMVILSQYNITGDIQIRFVVNKSTGSPFYDDLIIDDVYVEEAPTCPAPAGLGATFIASNSADLLWTSFSGLSDIEFGLAGFVPTGVPTYAGVVSPFTVTGLTTVTDYSFYVRDDCGGGDYSLWVGPYSFTTQPSCPQPFDLGATNLTMTSAELTWTSFSGLSDVEFGPSGFTPTGTPTYVGVTSPYFVDGLNTAAPYDFYVRDDCGGGDLSAWAGPYTLLTLPGTQTLPVFEDFETGFTYFNNAAGNGVDWTINTTYYHSGSQSAHNAYANTNTNILHETGVIDLSGAAIVWLDFWHIAKTEGDYDHCYVEISTDGGATYLPLPITTYTGTGIYVPALYNSPAGPCFDEDSYTLWGTGAEIPDNTWWQHETFDLSDYLTTNVRLRFRLHTDGSVLRYGWLVDEILIFEPAYGDLEGTVTNASGGTPIDGAMVSVGSLSTTTAADGTYTIPGVLVGNWTANCTKAGFNPASAPITIIEDQTIVQDFVLTAPEFVVDSTAVTVVLEPNELLDDSVNLSNPGLGFVDWSAGVVVVGDGGSEDLFDLQFSWPVGIGGGEAGIETDGNYIYTTKWNGTVFYRYAMDGTYIEEFACGAAGAVRDLAYDGTYFYGSAANTTVYQMDFDAQTLVSSITAPAAIRALAYSEDDGLFYGNNWSEPIQKFDVTGASQGSFAVGPYAANLYGLAYDNYCDGTYLWAYAQVGTVPAEQNWLVQIELPAGTETGVTYNVANVVTPVTGIAGGLCITNEVVPGLWTIMGMMQNEFIWGLELCTSGPVWLTIEPTNGMLGAGEDEDMTLHFNATDLLPGVYEAEIHFGTSPNVGSPMVEVTMHVEGLIPPIGLVSSYVCTDVELEWQMPTGGTPDSWNVYKDDVLLGNSTTMEYTDPMVMTQTEYGYKVKAVYGGEESMPTATNYVTVPNPGNLQPLGLVATANTPTLNHVTLEWNEPNACLPPDGYNVYRAGVMVNTALVTDLTYVDGPLTSGLYEYKLKAVYYFGESGFSTPAYALIPVGIDEVDDGMFKIFPNPASDFLTVESTVEIEGIKIFTNSGQLILDKKVDATTYQVDVSQFEHGVYYIRLESDDTIITRKITVK